MLNPPFKLIKIEEKDSYGQFVIEPLRQGYGHTLGNILRRVLLSDFPGAAITRVKIKGIPHQFTTLTGLKEDIVELILNLKTIRVKLHGDKPGKITLNVKGPKEVTAADAEVSENVEIMNKDLYLGSLATNKNKLEAEMVVEQGVGYVTADEHERTGEIGVIPVDSLFSPIERVNYTVEATRVGKLTNFDKLSLQIWTDGTLVPSSALDQAARMLMEHFHAIFEPILTEEEEESPKKDMAEETSKMTVEELDLPTRITNSLKKGGIKTVQQLLETPDKKLLKIKNMGVKSIETVKKAVKEKGYEAQG